MNFSCILYSITLKTGKEYLLNLKTCGIVSLIFTLPTILLNTSLVIVLLKSRDRSKPCNAFLLNLVITDCLCGYLLLPFNSSLFYQLSQQQDPCSYSRFLRPLATLLGYTSFLSIFAITLERYTAVFHPFFYETKLTLRTTVASIVTIWVFSIACYIPRFVTKDILFLRACIIISGVILPIFNFCCYYKILSFTRRVRKDMNDTRRRLGGVSGENNQRQSSLALTGALLLASMCVCFYPFVILETITASGVNSNATDYLQCWTWNLAGANSFLNAFFTCYQLSHLRRGILELWGCRRRGKSEKSALQFSELKKKQQKAEGSDLHFVESVLT